MVGALGEAKSQKWQKGHAACISSASLCETKKICVRIETSVRDLRVLGGALLFILQRYNIVKGKKELDRVVRRKSEIRGVIYVYFHAEPQRTQSSHREFWGIKIYSIEKYSKILGLFRRNVYLCNVRNDYPVKFLYNKV